MSEIISIVHEPAEGGYAAEALGQSIYTVAEDLEELSDMVRVLSSASSMTKLHARR
ncbi:MAG TPA: hypothetical protein VHK68_13000 [Gemmatimonadales bacterium]|jgi:hypothetical protein|nr:hypothetical protein [Gemmatimonadales bacterium]